MKYNFYSIMRFFLILIVWGFWACKENSEAEITIYFFSYQFDSATPIITCEDMSTFSDIRKIKVAQDSEIYHKLIDLKNYKNIKEIPYPDVRFKIQINDAYYCLSYLGAYISNTDETGMVDFVEEIKNYIAEHYDKSVEFTETY